MSGDYKKFNRFLCVAEAMLEYLVSIAVGTVYLAKITDYLGISDEITAVLSAFVSLGCGFQVLSIFYKIDKNVKKFITAGYVINQLLFTFLYVLPLIPAPNTVKSVMLIIALFSAQIILNVVSSPRTFVFMSFVDDDIRGKFTAFKEMVSLTFGICFSLLIGFITDKFTAKKSDDGFLICAVILAFITVLHTLTLVFIKNPQSAVPSENEPRVNLKELMKDKALRKVIAVTSLWAAANYATLSFSGTYMNNELNFSLTFSSIIIVAGSLLRTAFSFPLGKLADKKGFSFMMTVALFIAAAGYAAGAFSTPKNGAALYPVFYALYSVSMAGINSATMNLIYDYVSPRHRPGALALNQSVSGVCGFLTTVLLTPAMRAIKARGNIVFGLTVYSQQIFAAVSLAISLLCALFIKLKLKNRPREETLR